MDTTCSGSMAAFAMLLSFTLAANAHAAAPSDPLSCLGHCGGQAPGGCWCDGTCCDFSDCCDDFHPHCGTCHIVDCGDPIDCTDNEGEPCGSDTNGGCNADPPVFGSITFGQLICGNLWSTHFMRDTDWYTFVISERTLVSFQIYGEQPVIASVITAQCPPTVLVSTSGCEPSATICLQQGFYRLVVVPADFNHNPCPGFQYLATISGELSLSCEGQNPFSCVSHCGGPAPAGCWCDEDCCTYADCCDDKHVACGGCNPDGEPCFGDLNNDHTVDTSDLLILLADWGPCPGCDADFNADGFVDVQDLLMLLSTWGVCATPP